MSRPYSAILRETATRKCRVPSCSEAALDRSMYCQAHRNKYLSERNRHSANHRYQRERARKKQHTLDAIKDLIRFAGPDAADEIYDRWIK